MTTARKSLPLSEQIMEIAREYTKPTFAKQLGLLLKNHQEITRALHRVTFCIGVDHIKKAQVEINRELLYAVRELANGQSDNNDNH